MFISRSSRKMTSGAAQSSPRMQIFIGYTLLQQRFSFHGLVIGNVQIFQNSGREIDDLRVVVNHRLIQKKDTWDSIGIHNMVPAPAPRVVFEERM